LNLYNQHAFNNVQKMNFTNESDYIQDSKRATDVVAAIFVLTMFIILCVFTLCLWNCVKKRTGTIHIQPKHRKLKSLNTTAKEAFVIENV